MRNKIIKLTLLLLDSSALGPSRVLSLCREKRVTRPNSDNLLNEVTKKQELKIKIVFLIYCGASPYFTLYNFIIMAPAPSKPHKVGLPLNQNKLLPLKLRNIPSLSSAEGKVLGLIWLHISVEVADALTGRCQLP